MILQVLFYAELETFVLKCKFNSKSLATSLKIFGCASACYISYFTSPQQKCFMGFNPKVCSFYFYCVLLLCENRITKLIRKLIVHFLPNFAQAILYLLAIMHLVRNGFQQLSRKILVQ